MKIDVVVRTYNSRKYLDACLSGINQSFDVNHLIVVDHNSTDGTIEIAKRHGAMIYSENLGIGYALGFGVSKAQSDIFAVVDSDVVLVKGQWVDLLFKKFENPRIGGVGLTMFSNEPLWRQEYCALYMRKRNFRDIRGGTWVNAYIVRKKALGEHFSVPASLKSYEHIYLRDTILKHGYETDSVDAMNSVHYYDYPEKEGYHLGAGERMYYGLNRLLRTTVRQALLSPVKAILPAVAYNDPNVIFSNTKFWFDFLKGYLDPQKHLSHMERGGRE